VAVSEIPEGDTLESFCPLSASYFQWFELPQLHVGDDGKGISKDEIAIFQLDFSSDGIRPHNHNSSNDDDAKDEYEQLLLPHEAVFF